MEYVQLTPSGALPDISTLRPFKAILVADEAVARDRQAAISTWLVEQGCMYMMAWGVECGSWAESVSEANHGAFAGSVIPDDRLIIVTSHENESLQDAFWFSKHTAMHPCFSLQNITLLHLSSVERERVLVAEYASA